MANLLKDPYKDRKVA